MLFIYGNNFNPDIAKMAITWRGLVVILFKMINEIPTVYNKAVSIAITGKVA